jgi:signal transduction histidine kinase
MIFQKLHPRDHSEGTGIGLAICKKVVERHGGRITVASELGRGATFAVHLPKLRSGGGESASVA